MFRNGLCLCIKYFSNKLRKIITEVILFVWNNMWICTLGGEESCFLFVFDFWTASYEIAFYYRRWQTRPEGSSACFASLINLVWSGYSFTNRSWREGNTASRVCRGGGGCEPGGERGCDGRGWRMARAEPSGRTLHLIDSSHSSASAAERTRSLTWSASLPPPRHLRQVTFLLLAYG